MNEIKARRRLQHLTGSAKNNKDQQNTTPNSTNVVFTLDSSSSPQPATSANNYVTNASIDLNRHSNTMSTRRSAMLAAQTALNSASTLSTSPKLAAHSTPSSSTNLPLKAASSNRQTAHNPSTNTNISTNLLLNNMNNNPLHSSTQNSYSSPAMATITIGSGLNNSLQNNPSRRATRSTTNALNTSASGNVLSHSTAVPSTAAAGSSKRYIN